ncbi:hypothetical protein RRG08_057610, partial [Elysia crispata]
RLLLLIFSVRYSPPPTRPSCFITVRSTATHQPPLPCLFFFKLLLLTFCVLTWLASPVAAAALRKHGVTQFFFYTLGSLHRPFEPKEIARRAKEQVGRPLIYKLYDFNCEHFANECRYGVKRSFQAEEVKGIKKLMEQYEKAASRFPSWSDEDDEGEQETAAVPMLQMA